MSTYGALAKVLGSSARAVGQVRRHAWACMTFTQLGGLDILQSAAHFSSQYYSIASLSPQGMKRNPFVPIVPCHRVVAATLEIGGYHGAWVGVGGVGASLYDYFYFTYPGTVNSQMVWDAPLRQPPPWPAGRRIGRGSSQEGDARVRGRPF